VRRTSIRLAPSSAELALNQRLTPQIVRKRTAIRANKALSINSIKTFPQGRASLPLISGF
jgi:hypothetical protein